MVARTTQSTKTTWYLFEHISPCPRTFKNSTNISCFSLPHQPNMPWLGKSPKQGISSVGATHICSRGDCVASSLWLSWKTQSEDEHYGGDPWAPFSLILLCPNSSIGLCPWLLKSFFPKGSVLFKYFLGMAHLRGCLLMAEAVMAPEVFPFHNSLSMALFHVAIRICSVEASL